MKNTVESISETEMLRQQFLADLSHDQSTLERASPHNRTLLKHELLDRSFIVANMIDTCN